MGGGGGGGGGESEFLCVTEISEGNYRVLNFFQAVECSR